MIRMRRVKAAAPYKVGGLTIPADAPFLKVTFTTEDVIEVGDGIFALHVWGHKMEQLNSLTGSSACTTPERSGLIERLRNTLKGKPCELKKRPGSGA